MRLVEEVVVKPQPGMAQRGYVECLQRRLRGEIGRTGAKFGQPLGFEQRGDRAAISEWVEVERRHGAPQKEPHDKRRKRHDQSRHPRTTNAEILVFFRLLWLYRVFD